jgi:hypothetical protein
MKRVIVVLVLCLGGFSLVPALAAADERGAFVTLDRVGTASEVGLEVSALFYTSGGPDFGLRENLHGRFVDPSGFGVFAQFSLAHAFAGGDTETAATNPEVGGLYVLKLDGVDVAFRVGVGIPVAPKTLNGLVTNAVVAIARFEDLALIGPDSLWLRPGVSLRAGARAAFAQLDLGIDVPIKTGRPRHEEGGASRKCGHRHHPGARRAHRGARDVGRRQ